MERPVNENDFLIVLMPEFKHQYRQAINRANNGDTEALKEQHRLIDMLARRINAHLGDGMDKPEGVKKCEIW